MQTHYITKKGKGMAEIARAYQHILTIDRLLRVAVCTVKLFINQVTPFIALIHLSFIQ